MTVVGESSAHAGTARVATSAASTDGKAPFIVLCLAVKLGTCLYLVFDFRGPGWDWVGEGGGVRLSRVGQIREKEEPAIQGVRVQQGQTVLCIRSWAWAEGAARTRR